MSFQTSSSSASGLGDLPAEVLIHIISCMTYKRDTFVNLRLVCTRFNELLGSYQHSISAEIVESQIPPMVQHWFPDLIQAKMSFAMIDQVQNRLAVLQRIEQNCYYIRERDGKQAQWYLVISIRESIETMHLQSAGWFLDSSNSTTSAFVCYSVFTITVRAISDKSACVIV